MSQEFKPHSRRRQPLPGLALLALLAAAAGSPAQASEVSKLARLVITGKWLSAEVQPALSQAAAAKVQQLPPVLVLGHRNEEASEDLQVAVQPRNPAQAL